MFKMKKQILVLVIGTLVSLHCFSQEDTNKTEAPYPDHTLISPPPPPEEIFYKWSLQGGGGIIYPVTNKALGVSLSGQYYLHFSGNYILIPHLFTGLEFEGTEFGSTSSIAAYNTLMFVYNAGIKVGYYTFMQKDLLFVYSLSFGPSMIKYVGAPTPTPSAYQTSIFMTPNVLASFRVNDELRIGIELSYMFNSYRFDPAYTGIAQFVNGQYDPVKDITGITTYFEWGFGVYWAFAEAKK